MFISWASHHRHLHTDWTVHGTIDCHYDWYQVSFRWEWASQNQMLLLVVGARMSMALRIVISVTFSIDVIVTLTTCRKYCYANSLLCTQPFLCRTQQCIRWRIPLPTIITTPHSHIGEYMWLCYRCHAASTCTCVEQIVDIADFVKSVLQLLLVTLSTIWGMGAQVYCYFSDFLLFSSKIIFGCSCNYVLIMND